MRFFPFIFLLLCVAGCLQAKQDDFGAFRTITVTTDNIFSPLYRDTVWEFEEAKTAEAVWRFLGKLEPWQSAYAKVTYCVGEQGAEFMIFYPKHRGKP